VAFQKSLAILEVLVFQSLGFRLNEMSRFRKNHVMILRVEANPEADLEGVMPAL